MFTFKVTRRCGHEETVTITGALPPGKQFKTAITKLEKAESAKLCGTCQSDPAKEEEVKSNYDWIIVAAMMLGILMFITVIGNIFRY